MPQISRAAAAWFKAVGYEVHTEDVARFHASKARIKVLSSPARTSKSYAAAHDVLPDIFQPGLDLGANGEAESMNCWIVAPNYDLAKEFDYLWSCLVARREAIGFQDLYQLGQKANSPGQGNMQINLEWGKNRKGDDVRSSITVKSATNLKSLQSEEVDVAILSEAARLDRDVWEKYLLTRTKRAIFPTTPDITAAYIWNMIQLGVESPQLGIDSFHFTPAANPRYDWTRFWVEHQKAESLSIGLISTLPVDDSLPCSTWNGHDCFDPLTDCKAAEQNGFAEQFLGLWVFHRGRVVPIREDEGPHGEPPHVIDEDRDWFQDAQVRVAVDYGYSDTAAAGFWLIAPFGQVVLRRCIYEKQLTADEFVDKIDDEWDWFKDRYGMTGSHAHAYVADPKRPEVEKLFRRKGLPVWNLNRKMQNSRLASHLALMSLLAHDPATNQPGMLIHRDCSPIIKEWRELRTNEKVRNEESATAVKGPDDGYDMARYFAGSGPRGFRSRTDTNHFERARLQVLDHQRRRTVRPDPVRTPGMTVPNWRPHA